MHKKKCWQCAELINMDALVCPHCRAKQFKHNPPVKPLTNQQLLIAFGVAAAVGVIVVISSLMSPKQAHAPVGIEQSSIASASPSLQPTEPSSYKVEILAMRRLKGLMRDPEAMETRNVRVPSGAAFLCGEVNGANAFGGKAGFRRFMVGGASEMPAVIEGDGQMKQTEFDDAWGKIC